jgi:hypothetical protein
MYEMEGPRPGTYRTAQSQVQLGVWLAQALKPALPLKPAAADVRYRRLLGCLGWSAAPVARCPRPLDCSGLFDCALRRTRHRCQIPVVRPGLPALPTFPGFPLGRIPSSVVRNFYCQPRAPHKGFPRDIQDSFLIHRTSGVYPLCTADFHRTAHNLSTTAVDGGQRARPGHTMSG